MSGEIKRVVQEQFGRHAQAFVSSTYHAKGFSLQRLVELADPKPHWKVLDVATGGGHTALAFAPHVDRVVAVDLTYSMLATAREFSQKQAAGNIDFVQSDSELFGLSSKTFNCATCRIAPHHFPDVASFVNECHRVLGPGGILALSDNIVSGEPAVANFVNTFEKLRDPSHHWAYSVDDWQTFLERSHFKILHQEVIQKDIDFDDWTARMGVGQDDCLRLRALLLQAPRPVTDWLQPRDVAGRLVFALTEMIILGSAG